MQDSKQTPGFWSRRRRARVAALVVLSAFVLLAGVAVGAAITTLAFGDDDSRTVTAVGPQPNGTETALGPRPGETEIPVALVKTEQGVMLKAVRRLTAAELKGLIDGGKALVVDVREADDYGDRHIPGAVSAPWAEFEKNTPQLPKDKEIVTYCA